MIATVAPPIASPVAAARMVPVNVNCAGAGGGVGGGDGLVGGFESPQAAVSDTSNAAKALAM